MTFTARFRGRCGACAEAIEPGQEIDYLDDYTVHADCDEAAPDEPARTACPTCWLVHRGECDR